MLSVACVPVVASSDAAFNVVPTIVFCELKELTKNIFLITTCVTTLGNVL